jgi:hypothetical protein
MATQTKTKQTQTGRSQGASPPRSQAPKQEEPRKPTTAVATREKKILPAAIADRVREDAGKGVSTDISDNLVPLIYVLQANSPPAMRGHARYIDGAQAGDMWLRNAPEEDQIVSSDEGFVFQPCYFQKEWVEWQPERKGFAGRHKTRPDVAEQQEVEGDDGKSRMAWLMPNGNRVVETRYHAGIVHLDDGRRLEYMIPLSSTGHTVSKAWMFSMNQETDGEGNKLPSFALLYRLKTNLVTRDNNSWYMYSVSKEGYVETVEDYERGRALYEGFASGAKRADEEAADLSDEPAGGRSRDEDRESEREEI